MPFVVKKSDAPNYGASSISLIDHIPRILILPPLWALAVMAFIGLIDPVSHGIIRSFRPEGAAPTGGHTVDTIFYLAGMEHAHPPWTSPYTLCGEPYTEGDSSSSPFPFTISSAPWVR